MRLSAFTVCDTYPARGTEGSGRLAEFLRLAEVAERAGLHAIWVGEHHFRAGGVCPSPPVLLAAAAQRTRRIRLGVLVSVLPLHSAVSLAEEYAMVDVLSGGRLNLGVGTGYVPEELRGHGVDPAGKRERFDAVLTDLTLALRGEPIAMSTGSERDLRINVRPVQRPHPPLWVAVRRAAAVEPLARAGRSIAVLPYATIRTLEELAHLVAAFRRAAPPGARSEVAVAVHLYLGPRPGHAREALGRYLDTRLTPSTGASGPPSAGPRGMPSAAEVERAGFALFGSTAEVTEGLRRLERAGVDELLGMFDFGGLAQHEAHRSLRALAAGWLPRGALERPEGAAVAPAPTA